MSRPLEHLGADSPRSNVTRQIDRLGIHSRSPSPAKRLRAHCPDEIAETPCAASPTKRIKTTSADDPVAIPDAPTFLDRLKSAAAVGPDPTPDPHPHPHPHPQPDAQPDVDRAALTWQDDEITGHEIDADPADDGEGINGLGFRPTPRIAAQRVLKRRQQVDEYRAREMSEARSLRRERRTDRDRDKDKDRDWERERERHGDSDGGSGFSGVSGSGDLDGAGHKRCVRFAD